VIQGTAGVSHSMHAACPHHGFTRRYLDINAPPEAAKKAVHHAH
jgi:hypothetical protein